MSYNGYPDPTFMGSGVVDQNGNIDPQKFQSQLNTAGLMGMSQALINAGAPSRTPVPLGAALGQGVAGGMNAQNQLRSGVVGQAFGQMQPGAQPSPNFFKTVYGTPGLFGPSLFGGNLLATPPAPPTS